MMEMVFGRIMSVSVEDIEWHVVDFAGCIDT